ncbi:hypothetical protein PVAP13_9NG573800 [Panicum virgatum]|uniref:Uncharacterized protein n=1 Tax=Panicum virgatum TaxID=38727 RepID=A0A8T0MVL5_PANVG|nr:hypothetical protein PVAP13_9NG573800 [Panicum virgatum]KAG2540573.1 hypothetical protein PVAP13_9NG573800 [Panicum virgatum]
MVVESLSKILESPSHVSASQWFCQLPVSSIRSISDVRPTPTSSPHRTASYPAARAPHPPTPPRLRRLPFPSALPILSPGRALASRAAACRSSQLRRHPPPLLCPPHAAVEGRTRLSPIPRPAIALRCHRRRSRPAPQQHRSVLPRPSWSTHGAADKSPLHSRASGLPSPSTPRPELYARPAPPPSRLPTVVANSPREFDIPPRRRSAIYAPQADLRARGRQHSSFGLPRPLLLTLRTELRVQGHVQPPPRLPIDARRCQPRPLTGSPDLGQRPTRKTTKRLW